MAFSNLLIDQLVREIYSALLLDQQLVNRFGLLLDHLRQSEQLVMLEAIFRDIQKRYFSAENSGDHEQLATNTEIISSVAALCSTIIGDRSYLKNQISEWLCKSQGGSIQTIGLRRAILAAYHDSSGKFPRFMRRYTSNKCNQILSKHYLCVASKPLVTSLTSNTSHSLPKMVC
jgi:telomere length regulation protein